MEKFAAEDRAIRTAVADCIEVTMVAVVSIKNKVPYQHQQSIVAEWECHDVVTGPRCVRRSHPRRRFI
jgi:hypothetical protein